MTGTGTDSSAAARANTRNNRRRADGRRHAWTGVRDALWGLVDDFVAPGARVLLVGAGNADDLPLTRIAARAAEVVLVDVDADACHDAVRRTQRLRHDMVRVVHEDVTEGLADAVLVAAAGGCSPSRMVGGGSVRPVAGGGFDLAIGGLLYTQLLQAGLAELRLPALQERSIMERWEPVLTAALVRRLHASVSGGRVAHIHDLACWSPAHEQEVTLEWVLEDPMRRARKLRRQDTSDPMRAVAHSGLVIERSAWWTWPASSVHRYLVRGIVASGSVTQG